MIYDLIYYASVCAGFLPLVFLLRAKWSNLNLPLRTLFIYVTIALSIDLFIAFAHSPTRTAAIHNVFTIIECFLILAIYFSLEDRPGPFKLYAALSLGFICLYILGLVIEQRFYVNNYIGSTAEAFVLTYLSIRFYFQFVDKPEVEIVRHPFYWFNVAVMIYFSGDIFVFLFSKIILSPNDVSVAKSFWIIHSLLNVFYNILLAFGVYKWRESRLVKT